jgi:hypothetical protein
VVKPVIETWTTLVGLLLNVLNAKKNLSIFFFLKFKKIVEKISCLVSKIAMRR